MVVCPFSRQPGVLGLGDALGDVRQRFLDLVDQDQAQVARFERFERRLVMALQEGLPLFIRPFSVLASRVGCDESEVLERIRHWYEAGVIKRFGVVVRLQEADYAAHAMLVHDIPDAEVGRVGELLASEAGVTLCYLRPRALPDWPYNLFCMIHGQVRDEVRAKIAELRQRLEIAAYAHDILFSLIRFKTSGGQPA